MERILNDREIRVIGALIEKEMSTPEYYPMTVNGLVAACNQKSSREPVVNYSAEEVQDTLDSLGRKRLVGTVTGTNARSVKYRHLMSQKFELIPRELALIGVLLLRGPQTAGELRIRTERMFRFKDIAEVESVLKGLAEREEPRVKELPRLPGRKEVRFMHLFGSSEPPPVVVGWEPAAADDRVSALESEIESLKSRLDELETAFKTLKDALEG